MLLSSHRSNVSILQSMLPYSSELCETTVIRYRSERLQGAEQRCLPAHPRYRVLVDVTQHAHSVVVIRIDQGEVCERVR